MITGHFLKGFLNDRVYQVGVTNEADLKALSLIPTDMFRTAVDNAVARIQQIVHR